MSDEDPQANLIRFLHPYLFMTCSCTNVSSGFQENVFAVNHQCVHLYGDAGAVDTVTVVEIKLPSMPGAHQLSVFYRTLGQRCASVRTNIAQGCECSTGIGDADGAESERKLARFAVWREFGNTCNSRTLAHLCNISRIAHRSSDAEGI